MLDVVETQRLGGRDGGRGELHASSARRFQDPALVGKHSVEFVTDHPANALGTAMWTRLNSVPCDFPAPTAGVDQSGAPHEVVRDVDDMNSGLPPVRR